MDEYERARLLLDSTPLACRLWNKDFEIFELNDEAVRFFGAKNKQEVIDNYFSFSPEYQPDGTESHEKAIAALVKTFEEGKHVLEWMHRTADGMLLPTEITLIRVSYGNDFVVAGYTRDLREQKKMLEEIERRDLQIQEAYERTKILLDKTPFASHLWNRGFEMFGCNDENASLFKVSDKKELMERFTSFLPEYQPGGERSEDLARKLLAKAFEEGKCVYGEFMHKTSDGMELPLEVTLVRIPYNEDFVVAVYLRDLREQKNMVDKLRDTSAKLEEALADALSANQAKSDFLAKMSHEMRTPLNAVIGLSELSLNGGRLDEDDESNLERIYNSGLTLLSTVNDILDLSRIEAGRLELVEVDYDVPSLINDTLVQNMMLIGEKPVTIKPDIGEDIFAHIHGDELRVRQIVNNLLSNAVKYTQEGTVELCIRCTREGGAIQMTIEVRDTGRGVKPEDIGNLFSDYARTDIEANRKIEGTGLGLPITKKLTELMGGSISVQSEYGKGSVFTARIYQVYIDDERIGKGVADSLRTFHYSDRKRDQHANLNRIRLPYARVLVVDDNVTNLDVARGLMKPYGMHLDCVTSGQQAIDAIRLEYEKYNAVFMDYMMPGMDGIEAMEKIREIGTDYALSVPVIALTANAIVGNEEMLLNKGFQAFLSKPIDIFRLDEVLRLWVRDKEKEKLLTENLLDLQELQNRRSNTDRRSGVIDRRSGIDRRLAGTKLAGLDIIKGVERFGGDEETYLGVLRSFAFNTLPLLDSIEHFSDDDLPEYAITVHGIKGASRGVMAYMVGDSAELLEKAAKSGDSVYVRKHNAEFVEAARKLILDINEMLADNDSRISKGKKDKPDDGALSRLLEACRAFDLEAADEVMKEISQFEYDADDGLAAWLYEKNESMSFKEIVEKLSATL